MKKFKDMKIKYVIILVLALILIGAIIGLKMFFKPHADINKLKAELKVEQDESAATTKYSEKVLEISGHLAAKSKLANGTDLLILEDEIQGISCQIDNSWGTANQSVIESLETGSQVTIKGVCKGYLMEIKVSPAVVVIK